MKFNIERKEILKAITKLQGIIEKNNNTPILGSVLIESARANQITLFGTNLEISLHVPCTAEVLEEGKMTLDSRKVYEIVKELPDGPVALSLLENQTVQLSSGKSKFKLPASKAEDYPVQSAVKEEFGFEMSSESFLEMIKKTAFAIGENDSRYVLNGMLLFYRANESNASVRFVGTDGHRLAIAAGQVTSTTPQIPGIEPVLEKKLIVPKKAVLEMKKLVSEGEAETIHLGNGQNQLIVTIGPIRFSARLMEGTYPDYAKIVPNSFSRKATFRKDDLTQAIRRVSLLADANIKGIKMEIDEEKGVLSTQSKDSGTAEDHVAVDFVGEKIATGFNSRYILDTLLAIKHEEVTVNLNDSLSPTAFKDPSDENFLSIIMPMRVQ
jgi:DNA polymerase-3 subunit beta